MCHHVLAGVTLRSPCDRMAPSSRHSPSSKRSQHDFGALSLVGERRYTHEPVEREPRAVPEGLIQ
jgi:hypothetical protein